MCMDASPTGFYRVVQKVSDVIPVLGIMSRLPFLFPRVSSSVASGHVCREQTYAHSGIEPSRLAKGFLQGGGWAKKVDKIRIFLTICRLYVSQQQLKIEPYKQRTYLFNHPCTPCRNLVKPIPVKKLCRMRMAGLCQFY